eukprot:2838844-Rhodomonas_salina.2
MKSKTKKLQETAEQSRARDVLESAGERHAYPDVAFWRGVCPAHMLRPQTFTPCVTLVKPPIWGYLPRKDYARLTTSRSFKV